MTDDADDVFDEELALLLDAEHATDHQAQMMHALGRRMGAMYRGLMDGSGMDPEEAAFCVRDWMECAVFQRLRIEAATYPPDDTDDAA